LRENPFENCTFVPVNSKTAHPPPPRKPQGHLTFLKNFGHIPRYVTSLDGQMPHPFELQRGSNRLFKCTYSVMNNWLLFGLTIDPPWLFYGITYEKKLIHRIICVNKGRESLNV